MELYNLLEIANKSGLNRATLADCMGVSRMQLHRYLKEPNKMPMSKLVKLAIVLEQDPKDLINNILETYE